MNEENISQSKSISKLTWWLLGGLLFLRIPFMGGLRSFDQTRTFEWVIWVFEIGTYLLSAILIFHERERLSDFHIGKIAIAIFILGKPLDLVFSQLEIPFGFKFLNNIYLLYLPISIGLIIALYIWKPKLPKLDLQNLKWIIISILVGIITAVVSGLLLRNQNPIAETVKQQLTISKVILIPLHQMFYAGIAEEPLFRGFLWGILKKVGWKEVWIWLFQAGLFAFAHMYYWDKALISLFLIVPLGGLVMGFLSWRSRDISSSMIAHGLMNGVGQMVAFWRFF